MRGGHIFVLQRAMPPKLKVVLLVLFSIVQVSFTKTCGPSSFSLGSIAAFGSTTKKCLTAFNSVATAWTEESCNIKGDISAANDVLQCVKDIYDQVKITANLDTSEIDRHIDLARQTLSDVQTHQHACKSVTFWKELKSTIQELKQVTGMVDQFRQDYANQLSRSVDMERFKCISEEAQTVLLHLHSLDASVLQSQLDEQKEEEASFENSTKFRFSQQERTESLFLKFTEGRFWQQSQQIGLLQSQLDEQKEEEASFEKSTKSRFSQQERTEELVLKFTEARFRQQSQQIGLLQAQLAWQQMLLNFSFGVTLSVVIIFFCGTFRDLCYRLVSMLGVQ